MVVATAFAAPEKAHAWAWKDTCQSIVWNGSPNTVRLLTWFPGPPYPATSAYAVAAYIAGGVFPQSGGILLSNTGTPVTWGCHGQITYYAGAPVGQVNCTYSAPTRGANSFNCSGPVAWLQWKDDSDDIFVVVHILSKGPPLRKAPLIPLAKPKPPKPPKPSAEDLRAKAAGIHPGDLPGASWRARTSIKALGTLGQLWSRGTELASCEDKSNKGEISARANGGSLFVRHGGAESAFSMVSFFRSVEGANATFEEALTPHSAACLARLLSVQKGAYRTRATAVRRVLPGIDVRNAGYRVTIRGQVNKRPWSGYFDLVSLQHESKWALVGFFHASTPMQTSAEQSAVLAVAERLSA